MRLVSSQLAPQAPPEPPPHEIWNEEGIAALLALRLYETARRAAIAISRRQRFAVVGTNPSDPCNMIDVKRGFGHRQEIERGY